MPRITTLALCALAINITLVSAHADKAAGAGQSGKAIVAEPSVISPGQTVTLRWYFTGDKVTVTGGRFTKATVVTGRTTLTDTPKKTTRYTFDAWYKAKTVSPDTGKEVLKTIHSQQEVVVNVVNIPSLALYRNPKGWQVNHLSGWKCDSSDVGNNSRVFYFQKEDDSVERLAVAIMPATDITVTDVQQKIKEDVMSHYSDVNDLTENLLNHNDRPAFWTTFSGMDQTHPGTRTKSLILALVNEGTAYIISARTEASQFPARALMLERLVKSFLVKK